MSNSTANLELSEVNNDASNDENVSFDTKQVSSDQQSTPIIDSINQSTITDETTTTDETQPKSSPTIRPTSQTAIGAKVIKKLETLANSTENKQSNDKSSSATNNNNGSATATNETESRRIITKSAKSILKGLHDPDHQKNLSTLATKIVELQEQNRLVQTKINELEKRSTNFMRERDEALLENNRMTAAKSKLESLCRELHRHNQQIRDESAQRQRDDEVKRRDLATKFQTTIDDIASQLSNYSEKSTSLRDQNVELSEKLATVVRDYELREQEAEGALNKRELELRLTEASLEQSHSLLNQRTELITQERQVSEAERLVLYKKCEELASSELNLRSQVKVYSDKYQGFQNAIQQSSQMVTSCHGEIEKMGKKIKKLEKERNDFRRRYEIAEQNTRKSSEDFKLLEKEKRQLEVKLERLDNLSRALQQERSELQTTIKNLKAGTTNNTITSSNQSQSTSSPSSQRSTTPVNGHETSKNESASVTQSPNLYDSELGRMANTVD